MTPTTKISRKYTKLAPTTWAEIRALWQTGDPTLEELSVRFGVTTRTLQAHFEKHKTVKGEKAKEIAIAVREAVHAEYLETSDAVIAKAKEARASAFNNAEIIEGLVMAQLSAAQTDPAAAFRASAAIKTLALAAQALERIQCIKTAALGLDRLDMGEELPEIIICDLSEEEIAKIQLGHGDDESDDESEVRDDDDIVNYS